MQGHCAFIQGPCPLARQRPNCQHEQVWIEVLDLHALVAQHLHSPGPCQINHAFSNHVLARRDPNRDRNAQIESSSQRSAQELRRGLKKGNSMDMSGCQNEGSASALLICHKKQHHNQVQGQITPMSMHLVPAPSKGHSSGKVLAFVPAAQKQTGQRCRTWQACL